MNKILRVIIDIIYGSSFRNLVIDYDERSKSKGSEWIDKNVGYKIIVHIILNYLLTLI